MSYSMEAQMIKGKNEHWYSRKTNKRLYSPTHLLRPLINYKIGNIPHSIMEAARDRGKAVSEAIEVWETIKIKDIPKEHEKYFTQYMNWKKENKIDVKGVETHICNHEHSLHGYADLIVKYKNKIVGVEIKTRKKLEVKDTDLIQAYIYHLCLDKPYYMLLINENEYKFIKADIGASTKSKYITLRNFRNLLGETKIEGDR